MTDLECDWAVGSCSLPLPPAGHGLRPAVSSNPVSPASTGVQTSALSWRKSENKQNAFLPSPVCPTESEGWYGGPEPQPLPLLQGEDQGCPHVQIWSWEELGGAIRAHQSSGVFLLRFESLLHNPLTLGLCASYFMSEPRFPLL